jgi:hypothetical protein
METPLHVLTFHGLKLACPFSDKFRRHTEAERSAMLASVKASGIHESVKLYTDTTTGREDCLLDGEGRLTTAIELKLAFDAVRFEHFGELTTDAAYDIACDLNDSRRQDSPDEVERRKVERLERHARKHREMQARERGDSLRTIAEREGISLGQVQRDLAEAGVSPDTPETVKGKDGKEYPASKPKTFAPEPPPAPTYHAVEPPPKRPEPTPLPKAVKKIEVDWDSLELSIANARDDLNSIMATLKLSGSYEHTNGLALLDDFEALILSGEKKLLSLKWRHQHAG